MIALNERIGNMGTKAYGNSTGWEHEFDYLDAVVNSYVELAIALNSTETNKLIYVMQKLVPSFAGRLSRGERRDLKPRLERHLQDNRMCEIGYAGSQADDEDTTTVAQAARCALSTLED